MHSPPPGPPPEPARSSSPVPPEQDPVPNDLDLHRPGRSVGIPSRVRHGDSLSRNIIFRPGEQAARRIGKKRLSPPREDPTSVRGSAHLSPVHGIPGGARQDAPEGHRPRIQGPDVPRRGLVRGGAAGGGNASPPVPEEHDRQD